MLPSPRNVKTKPSHPLMRLGLAVMVPFLGLCTLFALVVTAGQAWQEHTQSRWPRATAHIDKCSLDRTSFGNRERYHIRCRLDYAVGTEQNAATVYSAYAPSPEIWQYPPNQIAPLETWMDEHPSGTPIAIRYDPSNHRRASLDSDYMPPHGGPRTPSNLKLLAVIAASFVLVLTIARLIHPHL